MALQSILAQVTLFVTILGIIAVFIEAVLEGLSPLLVKVKDVPIRTTIFTVAGAILGFLAAWGLELRVEDYFNFLPMAVNPWVSYVLIGCAAGAPGSRFWHAVLGFLQSLKLPKLPTEPPVVG